MKNKVLLILLTIFFACDQRDDFIVEMASKPMIFFAKSGIDQPILEDSVKFSVKTHYTAYNFDLYVADSSASDINLAIHYTLNQGKGYLLADGDTIRETSFNITSREVGITFIPEEVGIYEIVLKAEKDNIKSKPITLKLTAFDNLPPVASFELKSIKVLDNLEYQLDASESYDRDGQYGGSITKYAYTINGVEVESTKDKIFYIFPEKGSYIIKLRVKDNNDVWSDVVEKIMTI